MDGIIFMTYYFAKFLSNVYFNGTIHTKNPRNLVDSGKIQIITNLSHTFITETILIAKLFGFLLSSYNLPRLKTKEYIELIHIKIKISSKDKRGAPKDLAFDDLFAIAKKAKPLR